MGDRGAPALDSEALVRLLDRHRVAYVLIGGIAAVVHGATRATFDIDIVPRWDDENLRALASALAEAGARLRVPGAPEPVREPLDERTLRHYPVTTWRTRHGDIDVVIGTPTRRRGRLATNDDLAARALARGAFGATVLVAALDDIIESKESLDREPDRVALPELRELLARSRRAASP